MIRLIKELVPSNYLRHLEDIEVDGVDTRDWPDLCDAYISYAVWPVTGMELTDEELDYINENFPDFVHECAYYSLH